MTAALPAPRPQTALPWYVAVTAPRAEQYVHDRLDRLELASWFPKKRLTKRGIARITEFFPMFPCYLFVSFDPADSTAWQRFSQIDKFKRVLTYDERPVPIAAPVLQIIADTERELTSTRLLRYRRMIIAAGAWVQIVEHPSFAGLFGKVSHTNRKSILVEVDLLGRATRVILGLEHVRIVR
jgi:transcription antitermination factor NusG